MSDTAIAAAAPPAVPRGEAKLDDIMLAMDVVDTLRHQEVLVAQELGETERERQLVDRLREIYRSQGIEVTDQILAEGVRALKESRFVYTPPPAGMARTLALLWVKRETWLKQVAVAIIGLGVVWGGYQYFVVGAAEREAARARIEIGEALPAELDRAHKAVLAEARVPEARDRAAAILNDGRLALERKDPAGARSAIGAMNALLDKLRQEYTLRVISRQGEQSGVWRIPPNRAGQRNYYLIVEAIGPNGSVLQLPITSEEDQKTTTVSKFGVRVPQQTFDQIRRDKEDDGIIQRAVVGQKTRGTLEPTYSVPVSGAITNW
ncbi:DUF6384 family protein [Prosthecomicrobium sp. N25]|uniref:DUF6384 family protein n=1 Tax=Prosthecomicrobium sp. N25 TaxID=3129254 RepID=UPI003077F289